MSRFILIDHYSGYIWGDVALSAALDPVGAARALDTEAGYPDREYEEHPPGYRPSAGAGAYYVYRADAPDEVVLGYVVGEDAAPMHGQNPTYIDNVTARCPLVAVVSWAS